MSDRPEKADNSLLERLNALRATSVSLDKQSSVRSSKPETCEDALSRRLKLLRGQAPKPAASETHPPPPPYAKFDPSSPSTQDAGNARTPSDDDAALDAAFGANLGTYDEFIDDLGAGDDGAKEFSLDKAAEHEKVQAVLDELRPTAGQEHGETEAEEGSSDDDSDGEGMQKESFNAIARALDELELEQPKTKDIAEAEQPRKAPKASESVQDDRDDTGLTLPSAPTTLSEPSAAADNSVSAFEASIARRMAALKGLPPAAIPKTDSLGLPEAPAFSPEDRPFKGVIKKAGYTDEDAKTWCVICLEDATIRCRGCDDDVYCARCWKEMHVGPRAGYDERGHQWETFRR